MTCVTKEFDYGDGYRFFSVENEQYLIEMSQNPKGLSIRTLHAHRGEYTMLGVRSSQGHYHFDVVLPNKGNPLFERGVYRGIEFPELPPKYVPVDRITAYIRKGSYLPLVYQELPKTEKRSLRQGKGAPFPSNGV